MSAHADYDPLYAAYVLILVLGLRKGEALGLVWNDVDFWLPLVDICAAALRERREEQTAARQPAGGAWQDGDWVFSTKWGTPIESHNFHRAWDSRCRKAGVRKITVHDGRRTCATLLVDLDVHPREVIQILRHAQISVTMEICAQTSSKATRAALKRLGDSLGS